MTNLFLGLIAGGVVVMASMHVVGILAAMRAARQVGDMAGRFEQDVQPILLNLQRVSEDAARASAQAAAQVERLDALVSNVAARVEETAATVQQTILQPVRDGLAVLNALKSIVTGFRGEPRAPRPPATPQDRPGAVDEELFIG